MNEYNNDDMPWDEPPNTDSNYTFSQFEQDCERESNEEISKPLDASLKLKRLKLPPPDAEAGERECGALWTIVLWLCFFLNVGRARPFAAKPTRRTRRRNPG